MLNEETARVLIQRIIPNVYGNNAEETSVLEKGRQNKPPKMMRRRTENKKQNVEKERLPREDLPIKGSQGTRSHIKSHRVVTPT